MHSWIQKNLLNVCYVQTIMVILCEKHYGHTMEDLKLNEKLHYPKDAGIQ